MIYTNDYESPLGNILLAVTNPLWEISCLPVMNRD